MKTAGNVSTPTLPGRPVPSIVLSLVDRQYASVLPRWCIVLLVMALGCAGLQRPCAVPQLPHGAPFLWKVQRGDGPVVWLYGTIHDGGATIPDAATRALDGATRFASELGDARADPEVVRRLARIERGEGIDQQLPMTDWGDLRDALSGVLREEDLRRARPWFAMSLLSSHAVRARGPSMDDVLRRRARGHGLPVDALETWEAQVTALDHVVGIADLRDTIHARATLDCDLRRLDAIYDAGDVAAIEPMLVIPRTAETVLWARNRAWLPRLEGYLGDGGAFVAVGLGHLLGEQGLVQLLVRAGYTVTRATS